MARLIDLAELIVRDVAELPDRTSPEDQPDMMLVTSAELDRIVMDRVAQVKDHEIERMRAATPDRYYEIEAWSEWQRIEIERLRAALESLTKDPPATFSREPDDDAEVIIKMRAIARAALTNG